MQPGRGQRKGLKQPASPVEALTCLLPCPALPCLRRLSCCPAPAGLGQHWGRVLSILEDMQAAGVPWDAFTCSALLSACQASGRWEQALAWSRAAQDVPGGWQEQRRAMRRQVAAVLWLAAAAR